jgi:hemerythrin
MEWKEDFSVQIPEIDKEHEILVRCVTDIERAATKESVQSGIAKLTYLARTHFTLEETLMRILGYAGIDAHIQEHKKFLADLVALEKESSAGGLSPEAIARLKTWLEEHFVSDDKQYASLLSKENKQFVKNYYS